jgi:hypothetical protein
MVSAAVDQAIAKLIEAQKCLAYDHHMEGENCVEIALAGLRAEQERAQEELETTIAAAVAAEREACAQIADEKRDDGLNADLLSEPILWVDGYEHGCCDVATAIRARSEPKTGGVA